MLEFLFLLLVASILGSVGAAIAGRRQLGCLTSIAVGFIGAVLGRWGADRLEIEDIWTISLSDQDIPVFSTLVGAAVFIALLNVISGRNRPRGR
jgi:uncharacterized membrane protein YeaQ/YmgE (transglycosylase-associated protein family)